MTTTDVFMLDALLQTVVYWAPPTSGTHGPGSGTFAAPTEVAARVDERVERFRDFKGTERMSRSIAYVASDMVVGGYLYVGALDDLSVSEKATPNNVATARQIRLYTKERALSEAMYVRTAWL